MPIEPTLAEPMIEQIARLAAGYAGGWPDETTRERIMAAVRECTVGQRRELSILARAVDYYRLRAAGVPGVAAGNKRKASHGRGAALELQRIWTGQEIPPTVAQVIGTEESA